MNAIQIVKRRIPAIRYVLTYYFRSPRDTHPTWALTVYDGDQILTGTHMNVGPHARRRDVLYATSHLARVLRGWLQRRDALDE